MDITKFPPLLKDFKEFIIMLDRSGSANTNNSMCAANKTSDKTARGLSLISEDRMAVQELTLSYSGAVNKLLYTFASSAGLMALLGL